MRKKLMDTDPPIITNTVYWKAAWSKPRAYYTKWSKWEIQIPYINAYIWNLERLYWWTYLQGSSGDADIENRLLDAVGKREGRMIWECSTEACLPYVKYMAGENLLYDTGNPKLVLCDNPEGWDGEGGLRGRGHMYTCCWFMLLYDRNHYNIVK